jgi:hypothetical protein
MIVGTFKGADGSCGFEKNKDYIVNIEYQYGKYWLFGCKWDTILDKRNAKEQHACPYDNIEGILRNSSISLSSAGILLAIKTYRPCRGC